MVRFLSRPWADELNAALENVVVPGPGPDADLSVLDGRFTVVEEVHGSPDGDLRLVLRFGDGALHLEVEPCVPGNDAGDDGADVTIVVSYEDAAAMSRGELAPAAALNSGRIRVRGDLSVLVAAQQMFGAALTSARAVGSSTTY